MARSHQRAPVAELDSTLDFLRLLWSIENFLQSSLKRMAASLGITGPQRLAPALQRLIDKGLLSRQRHATDRRGAHLRVRPAALKFTRSTGIRSRSRALRRMPKTSFRQARKVLSAMIDELN